jgi:hypothetical protein
MDCFDDMDVTVSDYVAWVHAEESYMEEFTLYSEIVTPKPGCDAE